MTANDIENFKGASGNIYSADLFFKFPYIEDFVEKDYICLFITRYKTRHIICFHIEFKELLDNKTFIDIDKKAFLLMELH